MVLQPNTSEQWSQLQTELQQLEIQAQLNACRYLVVLSGDEQWSINTLAKLLPTLQTCHTLLVSDECSNTSNNVAKWGIEYESVQAKQVKTYLGSEVCRLIWNGFSGLNPDALGAASGLVKGGGLLFLLLPDLSTLATNPDPDYLRMCRHAEELQNFGTRFLQRLIKLIQTDTDVSLICQASDHQRIRATLAPNVPQANIPQTTLAPKTKTANHQHSETHLTSDQLNMIEGIQSVSNGHRKRPLVVLADRGRGKTSALGIAAANIVIDSALTVLITAPSRRACDTAFQHYRHKIHACNIEDTANFEFIAPDTLIEHFPACHILLVDEAASIPAPMLQQMLEAYPRIVFSSTTHGYEGTGQGFNVRFRHTLDALTPQWKSLTLHQPVRWSNGDPLERWIFEFLLLNAQIPELSTNNVIRQVGHTVKWVSQDTLANDTGLLKQVTALLVTAHYQTSPSDIRMILDDPKLNIGLILSDATVIAVVLLLHEGGIDDSELAHNIIEGTRRPKGHLVPQALTSSTANPDFLSYHTYRIMRIAVHPSLSRLGLGSTLLRATAKLGETNKIDYLSASFGFTPSLNNFWCKNDFKLLRVGYHKDSASGVQSAIVVRKLTAQVEQTIQLAHKQNQQHFIFGLNTIYRTLDIDTTLSVIQSLSLPVNKQSLSEIDAIKAFAHHFRSFENCAQILFEFVLNCFSIDLIKTLSIEEQKLICLRILKGEEIAQCCRKLNLSGKKQLDITLKSAISKLLQHNIQNN
jgi:tRNA(Met) cytidine acetyltransferase